HVGKSVITAALCRFLKQDGFRVAPFKAQNMSNNSYVTSEGGEIGRAQAVQAEACGIEPSIHMNPILLKPSSDLGAQVVVHGKLVKTMQAQEYQFHTLNFLNQVRESLEHLMNAYEVVVIEGAGSPAEINLQDYDIVNMRTAEMADAPVILVGDIDRGGIFASFVGTLELIQPHYRERVKAFLINKFRGDASLLQGGIEFLTGRTQIPTLGIIPYDFKLGVMEEDGLSDERIEKNRKTQVSDKVLIDVVWLSRISNFTDFHYLDQEKDVTLTYLREIPNRFPDVCIIPGTKSTMADLEFLRASGFDRWIRECVAHGVLVIGICGGYQMLGERILDPLGVESNQEEVRGLGLIPTLTTFGSEKVTKQVRAVHLESGIEVKGYEIRMGETKPLSAVQTVFQVTKRGGDPVTLEDGVSILEGQIWGTYLHGIFDSAAFRNYFLNPLRKKKKLSAAALSSVSSSEEAYDRLADLVRSHMNCDQFYKILNREELVQI
ncbi:MAG: cobyric acid synthase, partial [Candidatus Omnitrophica bacterium]|nr:cobyric acid synthase [Candidatus Omnitrophota bacterium]